MTLFGWLMLGYDVVAFSVLVAMIRDFRRTR